MSFSAPPPPVENVIDVQAVMRKSIHDWQAELTPMDTDQIMGDGSINNLIYTKLKGVFSALLDAAIEKSERRCRLSPCADSMV